MTGAANKAVENSPGTPVPLPYERLNKNIRVIREIRVKEMGC